MKPKTQSGTTRGRKIATCGGTSNKPGDDVKTDEVFTVSDDSSSSTPVPKKKKQKRASTRGTSPIKTTFRLTSSNSDLFCYVINSKCLQ